MSLWLQCNEPDNIITFQSFTLIYGLLVHLIPKNLPSIIFIAYPVWVAGLETNSIERNSRKNKIPFIFCIEILIFNHNILTNQIIQGRLTRSYKIVKQCLCSCRSYKNVWYQPWLNNIMFYLWCQGDVLHYPQSSGVIATCLIGRVYHSHNNHICYDQIIQHYNTSTTE